jgi:hypothetical protein
LSVALREVRPFEEEALFNPAFLALVIRSSAKEHEERGGRGMPVVLAYVVAPLALHRATREGLPTGVTSQMAEGIRSNPLLVVDLADRARALRPLVSAGICIGLRHAALHSDGNRLRAGTLKRRSRELPRSAEVEGCLSRAGFVGRWFAEQPDPATTLALWGLRP